MYNGQRFNIIWLLLYIYTAIDCTNADYIHSNIPVHRSAASNQPVQYNSSAPLNIVISGGPLVQSLIQSAIQSYQLLYPLINITYVLQLNQQTKQSIELNQIDLGFYIGSESMNDSIQYPDTRYVPILINGVAPYINIPGINNSDVALSCNTLAMIFTGDIQYWNDTVIQAENPSLIMPNHTIIPIIRNTSAGLNNIFCYALSQCNTRFAETVGYGFTCNFTNATFMHGIIETSDTLGAPMLVQLTNYSITYGEPEIAHTIDAVPSRMWNRAGNVVDITTNSVYVAAIDRGVNMTPGYLNDFSGAYNTQSWPIAGLVMLLYNTVQVKQGGNCESKQAAIQFIDWFTSSISIELLGSYLSLVPTVINQLANVPDISIQCNNVSVPNTNSVDIGVFGGVGALGLFQSKVLSFYYSLDSSREYDYTDMNQVEAIDALTQGTIDVAVLTPDFLTITNNDTYTEYIASNVITVLPSFLTAAIPIHNVPSMIRNLDGPQFNYTYNAATVSSENFGVVSGITLDMPTLGAMYTGGINDWTHPNISTWTPWLKERIDYLQSINSSIAIPITVIICCRDSTVETPALQIIAYGLYAALFPGGWFGGLNYVSDTYNHYTDIPNQWQTYALPFSWHHWQQQLDSTVNYIMVDHESQLYETVLLHDGAISYTVQTTDTFEPDHTFSIIYPPLEFAAIGGVLGICLPDVNGLTQCVIQQVTDNWNEFSLQLISIYQSTGCWPFSQLISLAVMSEYNSNGNVPIPTANQTLNMIQWLLSDTALQSAALSSGIAPMSLIPSNNSVTMDVLQSITCNGKNCLITLPIIWSLSDQVALLAYITSVIMIVLVVVSSIIIYLYRKLTEFRSASVIFLQLILFGLVLLYSGCILLVQSPSIISCSMFGWLINFGLELTFVPLFMKMYRIYRIFSRRKLNVVKLNDSRLLMYSSVLFIFDLSVCIAWQINSPLQPTTINRWIDAQETRYTQCNIIDNDMRYIMILSVEKAGLLLFGSIMSFTTRKVSHKFNESTSVTWSIYNTVLATCVIILVISFIDAVGSSLVVLMLIVIYWIATSIYILIFVSKLYSVTVGVSMDGLNGNNNNSFMANPHDNQYGFSFVSIEQLDNNNIIPYCRALELHTRNVQNRRRELIHTTPPYNNTANHHELSNTQTAARNLLQSPRANNHSLPITNPYQHEQIAPVRRGETPKFVNDIRMKQALNIPDPPPSTADNAVYITPEDAADLIQLPPPDNNRIVDGNVAV